MYNVEEYLILKKKNRSLDQNITVRIYRNPF